MNNGLNKQRGQYQTGDLIYRRNTNSSPGPGWISLGISQDITKFSNLSKILNGYQYGYWTTQVTVSSSISAIAYGNGIWVAGDRYGILRNSTDQGMTWNTISQIFVTGFGALAYGNGIFVASDYLGNIKTSTDTINWNLQTSNFGSSGISAIAYGGGTWVAGGVGGALRTSTDNGITWNTQTSTFGTSPITAVVYGNGTWAAGASAGSNAPIRTSTDGGITWNTQVSVFNSTIIQIVYGNGTFVAVGDSGVRNSTDGGITWNTQNANLGASVTATVAYGNGVFLLGSGSSGGDLRSSTDNGVTWNTHNSNFSDIINKIAYGDGNFILTSNVGTVGGYIKALKYGYNVPAGIANYVAWIKT